MKKTIVCLLLSIVFFAAHSCRKSGAADADQAQRPVVTVRSKTLYKADLDKVLPVGVSAEDSVAAAKAYIDMWINDQLVYDKAKQNIRNTEEIAELVRGYERSLITNSYIEQLLEDRFSKSVSDGELRSYYEQNKDKFKLEDNIIKGLFLKIPIGSAQLNNFQKWYKQGTDAAIENIEKNTLQNAVGYEYFYDRWVNFDEVIENTPSLIKDRKQFLQTNKNLEVQDSSFVYLLNIKEYKLAGNEAPYDYIKGHLAEIFIEQRKGEYIDEIQKDLYDKAISDEGIKFYNE